jgi:hypothetical protein
MSGCAGVEPRPNPPLAEPNEEEPSEALEILKGGCSRIEGLSSWDCSQEAIYAAGHGLVDAAFDLKEARLALDAQKKLGTIDKAELAGQLWDAQQDADHQSTMKWVWGAVGVAIGGLAAGLLAGLVR